MDRIAAIRLAMLVFSVGFGGCASSTVRSGQDFDVSKTAQIKTGETTQAQIFEMFGTPTSKSYGSTGLEIWVYSHTEATAQYHPGFFSGTTDTKGFAKSLAVRFRNGVVETYNRTETPIGGTGTTAP